MEKAIITTSSFGKESQAPLEILTEKGIKTIFNPFARKLTEMELHDLLMEHRPVGLIAGVEPITANVLKKSSDFLKVISRVGVGWDNVDHEAASELGMKIYAYPFDTGCTNSH